MTCVTGNTHVDNVLVNVLRIADLMGCGDAPVFRGAEEPLVHKLVSGLLASFQPGILVVCVALYVNVPLLP